MERCYLVVGLGNPGREYAQTRHNAGYMAVERLGQRWQAAWRRESRFRCRLAKVRREEQRIFLCQPETFMNASGEAVAAAAGFYRLAVDQMLVVVDDADLPLGEVRMRARGSSGGHHGLESIEQQLGTRQFARLRVGIGRSDPAQREITDYVLARFGPEEAALVDKVLDRAADQMECWVRHGAARAMNQFNGVIAT